MPTKDSYKQVSRWSLEDLFLSSDSVEFKKGLKDLKKMVTKLFRCRTSAQQLVMVLPHMHANLVHRCGVVQVRSLEESDKDAM